MPGVSMATSKVASWYANSPHLLPYRRWALQGKPNRDVIGGERTDVAYLGADHNGFLAPQQRVCGRDTSDGEITDRRPADLDQLEASARWKTIERIAPPPHPLK